MEPRDRVTAVVCGLALAVALLGARPVAAANPAPPFGTPDVLEPAKSALRLKQFGDAASQLGRGALAEDPRAQYLLGTLYLNGLGVAESPERARSLFESAAARGRATRCVSRCPP